MRRRPEVLPVRPGSLRLWRLACVLGSLAVATNGAPAKDFFGNNTPWTNADTRLAELAAARERRERSSTFGNATPYFGGLEQRIAERDAQRVTDRESQAAAAVRKRREEREARQAEWLRLNPPRPATWAEQMADYVRHHGDAKPEAREQLAFHYVAQSDFALAEPLLGVIAHSPRPRAGEAHWVLATQIHGVGGSRPDPERATEHRRMALARGYYRGLLDESERLLESDRVAALAGLETVMAGSDPSSAAYATRDLFQTHVAHGQNLSEFRRAVQLRPLLEKQQMKVDPWFEGRLAHQLIAAPGGWAEHHAEIVAFLQRAAPYRVEAAQALAQVYLGQEPAARAVVPADPASALTALGQLAANSVLSAGRFLPQLLAEGPTRSPDLAALILRGLIGEYPSDDRIPLQLAGVYVGDHGSLSTAEFARARDFFAVQCARSDASTGILLAAARFLEAHPGTAANPAKQLFDLYQRPAALKNDYAQYRYARAVARGEGIPADPAKALDYLKNRTARDQIPEEAFPLYVLHAQLVRESVPDLKDGLGYAQRLRSVRDSIDPAVKAGFPLGLYESAACIHRVAHTAQAEPLEDDEKKSAFDRAERAARTGLTEARLLVARFYREAFGTAADPAKALAIYTEAAEAGVPTAARRAEILLDPAFPGRNPIAGHALAVEAAAAGDAEGLFLLAECHARGWGTPSDAVRAQPHYAAAARAGWPPAMRHLGLAQLANLTRDNYDSTVALLRVPAARNDPEALLGLLRAVFLDPHRKASDQRALVALRAGQFDQVTDAEKEAIQEARMTLIDLQSELRAILAKLDDPERLFQTGLLLSNEPNRIAPPYGLAGAGDAFFRVAAERGHPAAQYRRALEQLRAADESVRGSTDQDALDSAEEEREEARETMRTAAAAGHVPAQTWLKRANLPAIPTPQP